MKNIRYFPIYLLALCAFSLLELYSCAKEATPISPLYQVNSIDAVKRQVSRQLLNPPPTGFYDVVTYSLYQNLTIGQYALKARISAVWGGFNDKKSTYGAVLISNISTYRNSLSKIPREEFDSFISQFNDPAFWPKWFTYTDGKKYVIYRNWTYSSLKPKPFIIRNPQDMRFSTLTPYYYVNDGGFISCNLDPLKFASFGLPQKIISIPATLKFTAERDTNNIGHIGIKPVTNSINQGNLQTQMDLITVEAAQ